MIGAFNRFNQYSKFSLAALSLGLVAIIGLFDFLTGFELYFFSFYLIPVILATWFVSREWGFFVSFLCVGASIAGDWIAGARYSSSFVLIWNTIIALAFYFAVVWILARFRSLYNELEKRVRERTAALKNEMGERMRLEEEILRISEREQLRIGHDLHDSLCQNLTGIALAGKVLSDQLAPSPAQGRAASHIVDMVEDAIELTRKLARGLHPVELEGEGLNDALQELVSTVNERGKISCRLQSIGSPLALPHDAAIHLFRIAQEALTNAVKHSRATEISIQTKTSGDSIELVVRDNGVGLADPPAKRGGMGLRIMAYRASIIGATFSIQGVPAGGAQIKCAFLAAPAPGRAVASA